MHRTTVMLEEELYRRAKKTAIDQRQSFKQLVETALLKYLSRPLLIVSKKKSPKFRVYRFKMKGDLRRETIYDWL